MAIVKPRCSRLRKTQKQLLSQEKELKEYMRQPSFEGQTPTRKDEAQKQLEQIRLEKTSQ
ncbi:MAG: hypothetical protein K0R66_1065 [Gammaproteobacteria bacterium]|jgi:hypothetical protein|nr:hypothetical protein [Gammaproteobacteria bacterium]